MNSRSYCFASVRDYMFVNFQPIDIRVVNVIVFFNHVSVFFEYFVFDFFNVKIREDYLKFILYYWAFIIFF